MLRRYSEFAELHQTLSRSIDSLPVLPPKLVLNTPEDLADRYLELDVFLGALLAMPSAAAHARLRSFLGADTSSVQHEGGAASGGAASTAERDVSVIGSAASLEVETWDDEDEMAMEADGGERQAENTPTWLLTGAWVADEATGRLVERHLAQTK